MGQSPPDERRSKRRGRDYLAWIDIVMTRIRFKLECHKVGQRPPESVKDLRAGLEALDLLIRCFNAGMPWPSQAVGFSRPERWPPGSEVPGHFERLEKEYADQLPKRRKPS